ncbi:MAG: hypothetical protein JWM11_4672 [Planctomycetaceae bacterium]|nr:hypothetical protein [Planctomycetaceae bacterium]
METGWGVLVFSSTVSRSRNDPYVSPPLSFGSRWSIFRPNRNRILDPTGQVVFDVAVYELAIRVGRGISLDIGRKIGVPDLESVKRVGKELRLLWVLLLRKIRINGSPRLLLAFGKCFPS